jgi:hypothetical protein
MAATLLCCLARARERDEFADECVERWVMGQIKAGFKQSQEEGRWFGKLFALTEACGQSLWRVLCHVMGEERTRRRDCVLQPPYGGMDIAVEWPV